MELQTASEQWQGNPWKGEAPAELKQIRHGGSLALNELEPRPP